MVERDQCGRFLYVSYEAPPFLGGGAPRTDNNCRLLPEFGWIPTLLTIAADNSDDVDRRYGEMGVEVLRASAVIKEERVRALPRGAGKSEASFLIQIARFLARWLLIPDRRVLWKFPAQRLAVQAAKRNNWKCVFSTMLPISTGWIGKCIAQRLRLPFVLEYKDIIDENFKGEAPSALHRAAIRSIERSLVRSAAKIVVVSPAMKDWLVKRHNLNPQDVELIPIGFLPEHRDFVHSLPQPPNQRFTMIYTGLFHGRRRPDVVLKAIRRLIDEKTIPENKIRAVFIGNMSPAAVSEFGLEGVVETIGMMPREEVLKWYARTDLLLLICAKEKYQNLTYPGKLFEYLMTEKPILGLVQKDSDIAKVLQQSGIGLVVDADDVQETAAQIEHLYKLWAGKQLKMKPNSEFIEQFNARKLTEKLASIFDEVSNVG